MLYCIIHYFRKVFGVHSKCFFFQILILHKYQHSMCVASCTRWHALDKYIIDTLDRLSFHETRRKEAPSLDSRVVARLFTPHCSREDPFASARNPIRPDARPSFRSWLLTYYCYLGLERPVINADNTRTRYTGVTAINLLHDGQVLSSLSYIY